MTRGYLLNTNVVSETRKRHPNTQVLSFLNGLDSSSIFASVLTLAELRRGAALKSKSDLLAAAALHGWADELEASLGTRLLVVDAAIARVWGDLHHGRTLPVIDSLLAATAIVHRLILVTRNTSDIADLGADYANPWL